jgi:hypothetical protein
MHSRTSLPAAISKPFDVNEDWLEFAQAPDDANKGIALSCSS